MFANLVLLISKGYSPPLAGSDSSEFSKNSKAEAELTPEEDMIQPVPPLVLVDLLE